MLLEDFLRLSIIPQIQINSVYIKPKIPQEKLANAVREYARGVEMGSVAVLIDETFWGNAKEGMLITNDQMFLSKKLGGSVIDFASVKCIEINENNLIVNGLTLAKISNPEVLPLSAVGSKLNEYILATKKASEEQAPLAALDRSALETLTSFLTRFTEPKYFDSTPLDRRTPGAKRPSYVLAANITEDQRQLICFKAGLAATEEVLCASWLNNHGLSDYFFFITDCGVYSLAPERTIISIPFDELRNLTAVEEYEEGRFVGVRLSNGQGIIVSIQNAIFRPYAYELMTGLINILNNSNSESRAARGRPVESVAETDHCENDGAMQAAQTEMSHEDASFDDVEAIPFNVINGDSIFEYIIRVNSIDSVGNFIGSILSDSEQPNTQIRRRFQGYVARSIKIFRNEIVEIGGFSQFKNDIATMEVVGAVIAFAFVQMQERGVDENLANRILLEGVRATFNINGSARNDTTGNALLNIVDYYISDENEDFDDMYLKIIMRLVGSNLSEKLRLEYFDYLVEYQHLLQGFILAMDPAFDRFVKKMTAASDQLVDAILNTRW